ncbi:extracellular solute-binding protein [Desmospora activa]|uniref:Carbohydrate ABC transporter substrate-binding protein (CUT1 family) n=1 Tax=Desmospora activa DSM 45169 TaxID=1121389 RepID=A0A2T4ZBZ0_9BACL|nr:extracellular solute-binding protein [Desmospora activa]PTM59382.1 carbohydrate ABC transporter substrate-binding protein (CUT1 family) [Desmospora activa DSM 45169]
MKKWSQWLSVAVVMLLVLTACGPQDDGTDADGTGAEEKPQQLVIWENDEEIQVEHTKKMAAKFEEETGIEVKVIALKQDDQQQKLSLDGPAGKGPDLVTWPHDNNGEAVLKGLIRPLEVDREVTSAFIDPAIEAMTVEGELYGLPRVTENVALFYNKAILEEAPKSYEDLVAFAEDYTDTKQKQYGFLFEGTNFYFNYFLFDTMGGYIFKQGDGTYDADDIGLNSEGSVKGMEKLEELYQAKLIPTNLNADTLNGLFKEGKVGAVISGPWAVRDYQDAGIDFGVVPIPTVEGKQPITFSGVKGLYLSAYSEHPYWATELMKFLTSEEALKERYEDTGEIPPVQALLDDPLIKDDAIVSAFAEQSKHTVPMPNIPEMHQVWEPMNHAATFVAQGKQTPQQALDSAVKLVKDKIKAQQN